MNRLKRLAIALFLFSGTIAIVLQVLGTIGLILNWNYPAFAALLIIGTVIQFVEIIVTLIFVARNRPPRP